MSFKDLKLKIAYNSDTDSVLSDFFVPLLKDSKYYKRVSAYYSSDSLKLMSEGLAAMLHNDGKVQIIVSYLTNKEDYDAIKNAKQMPDIILNKIFIQGKDDLEKLMQDDNVAALGYLLATNRLEIKFAICAETAGLFHLKFGIFIDSSGNYVGFSGSINETYAGLTDNIEEFKVFRSWVEDEKKYVENDSNKFDSYWNNRISSKEVIIADLPEEAKNVIIKEFNKCGGISTVKKLQPISLRPVQHSALQSWLLNNRRGILEMATGSGKTVIGIYALLDLLKLHEKDGLIIVIGCPTKALSKQWYNRLSDFYLENCKKYIINSTINKEDLYKTIKNSDTKKFIIIGTYSAIHKTSFIEEILPEVDYKFCLIADEAHWLGAPKYSKTLSNKFTYRLGLTATPMRGFDIEGTDKLIRYFDGIRYRYTLNQAVADGTLTKYKYNVQLCNLSESELREYIKLTKKYARYNKFSENKDIDIGHIILSKRAKIIKKAESKISAFKVLLEKLREQNGLSHLIVYCEDKDQIRRYLPILQEFGAETRIISDEVESNQRDILIDEFDKGQIDCILAMKIFDEGIDIPSALRGIFVSSTTNPRQFIQRRGRLLRKHENKKYAEIYDIMIAPDIQHQDVDKYIFDIETKILSKEIRRAIIFGASAINTYDCYKRLEELSKKYNISIWDMIKETEKNGR